MTKTELYDALGKITDEMTPGERIQAYLKGEEVDCIPYGFLAAEDALASIWGITMGEMHRSLDARAEVMKRMRDEYDMTGISTGLGLRGMGEAVGSVVRYPEKRTDFIEEHWLKDYDDLKKLEDFDVRKSSFLNRKIEDTERLMEMFPDMPVSTGVAGPVSTAIAIMPIEKFLREMSKDPEHVKQLLDFAVDSSLEWVKYFCERTGCRSAGIADPVTTTDIFGPKYFREFSKPYFKRLFDGIEEITGKKGSVHICGHTKKIWNDLADIGVNNFSLDNCESMTEAKEMVGDRMFLVGNVSPVDIMCNGTIDDVISSVKSSIAEGSDSPCGYMLMPGCQVPIGAPKENFDAFVYAAHVYGANARLGHACEAAL